LRVTSRGLGDVYKRQLVHAGDPESLAANRRSPTAPALALALSRGKVTPAKAK
jgi:hypothetical protein